MTRYFALLLLALSPNVFAQLPDQFHVSRIELATSLDRVPENIGEVVFDLHLDRPRPHLPVQVKVETSSLSASDGEDYRLIDSIVFLNAGQVHRSFRLTVVDDDVPEDREETLLLKLTSQTPGAVVVEPARVITIIDDDEGCPEDEDCEAECTFTAVAHYDDGPYEFKGKATVNDVTERLNLTEDSGRPFFSVDLSGLAVGGPAGTFSTRDKNGRFDVELNIEQNLDPGGVADWAEMTIQEQLESGRGLPNRLAERRLKGTLLAIWSADSGSGANRIEATFDAGNGPYHCSEFDLDAQADVQRKLMEMYDND